MKPFQHLRGYRPLAGVSALDHQAIYGRSMYSPNGDIRIDADAFEIRDDVTVEDACLTALRLMRMTVAQLELLGTSADLAPAFRDVVDGVTCIGRLACGSIGLVHSALSVELPRTD